MPDSVEQLEQRINAKNPDVKQTDLDATFKYQESTIRQVYKDNPDDYPAKVKALSELKAKQGELMAKFTALQLERSQQRTDTLQQTPEQQSEHVAPGLEALKAKETVQQRAYELTNPDAAGALIDDYEGYGGIGLTGRKTGFEDGNFNNPTRWALAGYLTAQGAHDPARMEMEFGKAVTIFNNSDDDLSQVDELLTYENLIQQMGMAEAQKALSGFDLASEPLGLTMGYWKIAEAFYPQVKDAYQTYLTSTLGRLKTEGKLTYTPPADETGIVSEYKKGLAQVKLLMSYVYSPKEWDETLKGPRTAFEKLQQADVSLRPLFKLDYKDARVTALLAKSPAQITKTDEAEITYANDIVAKATYTAFVEAKQKAGDDYTKVNAQLSTLETKNAALKKYEPADFDTVRTLLSEASAEQQKITLPAGADLTILRTQASSFMIVLRKIGDAKVKLAAFEHGLTEAEKAGAKPENAPKSDRYKKEWLSASTKEVTTIFPTNKVRIRQSVSGGAIIRDNIGDVLSDTIPAMADVTIMDPNKCKLIGDTVFVPVFFMIKGKEETVWVDQVDLEVAGPVREISENPELSEFLREKNLLQIHEKIPSGERTHDHYVYVLNVANMQNISTEGSPKLGFGNADVDRIFGGTVNRYLQNTFGDVFTSEAKMQMEAIANRNDLSEIQKVVESFHYILGVIKVKLGADGGAKIQAFEEALGIGIEGSAMGFFDKPPTLVELKAQYETQFIPAWEMAARHLEKAMGAGGQYEMGIEVPADLQFLQPVCVEYIGALIPLARFDQNPEQYPKGVSFDLRLNNTILPARLVRGQDSLILQYKGSAMDMKTNDVKVVMQKLNSGEIHQDLNTLILLKENNGWYEPWKDAIAEEIDELEPKEGMGPHDIYMDLEWDDEDALINIKVLPHGRISYGMKCENVGSTGGDTRVGYADNFYDFMVQLKHMRQWMEGSEHKPSDAVAARGEALYEKIVNPYNYRLDPELGRVIGFRLAENDMVQVFLDWGGGNDLKRQENAMLQAWVDKKDGTLRFMLTGHGLSGASGSAGQTRGGIGPEKATDFGALMTRVKALKAEAFGGGGAAGVPDGGGTDSDSLDYSLDNAKDQPVHISGDARLIS